MGLPPTKSLPTVDAKMAMTAGPKTDAPTADSEKMTGLPIADPEGTTILPTGPTTGFPTTIPTGMPTPIPGGGNPEGERVLVVVLGQTRAWNAAWPSFKSNVLDYLGGDLAVCVGVGFDYSNQNPYWQHAKYRFTVLEPP